METTEGEEAMSKHLPECIHFFPDGTPGDPCQVCDALRACQQRIWAEMFARIQDRMTDTDMDNLVSDDGKDYFWSVIGSMKPTP